MLCLFTDFVSAECESCLSLTISPIDTDHPIVSRVAMHRMVAKSRRLP